MHQVERRERLLADIQSGDDNLIVDAAMGLLELGELGTPAGTTLLAGAKAALRCSRLADGAVLLYHGVHVVEPGTKLAAQMLVNRAITCSRFGLWRDAIESGERFLNTISDYPALVARLVPYAHHAVGFAYDKRLEHELAVKHFSLAVQTHVDPLERTNAKCDMAYAMARCNRADDSAAILEKIDADSLTGISKFGFFGTLCIVRYTQGRFDDAMAAGRRAESLAEGHAEWGLPLADVHYWMSRTAWKLGDRYSALALDLHAAVTANKCRDHSLADAANRWLTEMMDMGGLGGE